MNSGSRELDKLSKSFLIILGIIISLGVIMVYSSSYMYAKEKFGNSAHFFFRQLLFIFISASIAFIVSKTKFKFWIKFIFPIHLICTGVLALTLVPGIGVLAKGANRWISLGAFSLQPGEMMKYSILLFSLHFFENFFKMSARERYIRTTALILPLILFILQPDFGTFSICFAIISFTCFLSSFPRKYFYSALSSGLVIGIIVLFSKPYRVKRITSYLDPWENSQGSGFQIIQSWMGFAGGGFWGRGPGKSIEKLYYLPEAHNDFILSVIGEELGFVGVFVIISLFVALLYFGLRLALSVKDRLGLILITSLIFSISIQALLNMGVVLGLLPTKGLNLPFISSGGSSLMANFFAIGLIMSVVKYCKTRQDIIYEYNGPN